MNKSELVDAIAQHADISKASAARALDATFAAIAGSLKRGDVVTLVGFGSFFVGARTARAGRNPRTGTGHPGAGDEGRLRCGLLPLDARSAEQQPRKEADDFTHGSVSCF